MWITSLPSLIDTVLKMVESEKNSDEQRRRAAAAVWQWKEKPFHVEGKSGAELRVQGFIRVAQMVLVAAILFYFERLNMAIGLISAAGVVGLLAAFSPARAYAALDRALFYVLMITLKSLLWLMLVFVYICFFAPMGSIFRRGNRGVIKLSYDAKATSYWQPVTIQSSQREQQF